MSIRSIAKELTRQDIMPRKAKSWKTSTLHRIIRNETYTGVTYYNKHIAKEPVERGSSKYRRRKNSSLRLRPKKEWIPIRLKDNLKIIDQEKFELAQNQLRINSKLSPRNVKNRYLLRGILKCGQCGSPYQGTPSHGKTYYRCGNRNRTFPLPRECKAGSIKASRLEEKVWDKMCEVLRNPKLILDQLEKMEQTKIKEMEENRSELGRINTALANYKVEENRLLDAYTGGVISMGQLKNQMEKIKGRETKMIEARQKLISTDETPCPSSELKKRLKEYCKKVRAKLKNLTSEKKQRIIRLLVNTIVVYDNKIRIKGVIPLPEEENQAFCHIASQSS